MLRLKNPHAVLAALQKRPGAVKSVEVQPGRGADAWQEVADLASSHGIAVSVQRTPPRRRPRGTERGSSNSALVEPPSPVPLQNLLPSGTDNHGLWLALDQVQDPQNLGAIFRLAGFFGVQGILLTKDRSAPVNETVCDVAAGGAEHVPWSVAGNLVQSFKSVQEAGVWILGTCERATTDIRDLAGDRSWMLVLGNEGDGLRRLTRERCDELCAIQPAGPVPSLNVATAAAACLTALSRR